MRGGVSLPPPPRLNKGKVAGLPPADKDSRAPQPHWGGNTGHPLGWGGHLSAPSSQQGVSPLSAALLPRGGGIATPPPSLPTGPFIYRHHQHARAVTQRETPQRPPATPTPRPLAARRAPPRPAVGWRARHTGLAPSFSPPSPAPHSAPLLTPIP